MIRPSACPICGRDLPTTNPAEKSYVPFCSERCQKVDFHRWWQGRYAIVEDIDPEKMPLESELSPDNNDE